MGLAASQARFLAITSRKAKCEFQSMQIAQQKLSTTRELEQATQDYQSALNTTKLVFDPDGAGTTPFDVSYDLIMRPSEVNDYIPFMISRSDGRIALNPTMARAAKLAGIPEDGTNANSTEMFNKFVEAMVSTGGMSETSAIGVRKLGYQPLAGLGGALLDKTQTADMSLGNLINYIDLRAQNVKYGIIKDGDNNWKFPNDYELVMNIPTYNSNVATEQYYSYNNDYTKIEDYGKYPVKLSESLNFKEESNYLSINGVRITNQAQTSGATNSIQYTLAQLLTDDVTLAFTKKSKSDDPTQLWKKILGNSKAFLNASTMLDGKADLITLIGVERKKEGKDKDAVSQLYYDGKKLDDDDRLVLEAVNEMVTGFKKVLNIGNSEAEVQAFNFAVLETLSLLTHSKDLGKESYVTDTYKACIDGANDYNCWVYKNSSKSNNSNTRAISISSLAESFLTFYAQAQSGFASEDGYSVSPYYVSDSAKDSYFVTDNQGYLYPVQIGEDRETAIDMYNTEYYSIMFNTLCRNGWYENIYIDDSDYLQNALKNGNVFITSLNETDGYCYQHRYNNNTVSDPNLASRYSNGTIMEITDEDAVTRAEREYAKAKSRLNYKEEELEIEMKNLDLEIASLSTEYDSIKSMISKNIEKTFTMFQS